jgi:AcrR family transcriptional regulator
MDRTPKVAKSAQDWVEAGLLLLGQQGVEAVKVEPLARELGVTKGSFYWHFRDRSALLAAILAHWQSVATQAIMDRIDGIEGTPAARLGALIEITSQGKRAARIEHGIRAWGARDKQVRAVLHSVDVRREGYVRDLLIEHGLTPAQASRRSRIMYLALIGEFAWISHGGPASGPGPWQELVQLVLG